MYGQYDKFVYIDFNFNSQAYRDFGPVLMGEFVYTLQERTRLEEVMNMADPPRTEAKIKFKPYDADSKLTDEQKVMLDRDGFLCSDIFMVRSSTYGSRNRFSTTNREELPNLIEVPFDPTGFSLNGLIVGHGDEVEKSGQILSPEENDEYRGTKLYYIEKEGKEIPPDYLNSVGEIEDDILYYKYLAIHREREATEQEDKDFFRIGLDRVRNRMETVSSELEKGGLSQKDILLFKKRHARILADMCLYFQGRTLLAAKPPIWWDFDRHIHIFFRHVGPYKLDGIFLDKTNFTYKLQAIERVMASVLASIKVDIEDHFKKYPDKSFKRIGSRSVYYDGVYYQIEIEPSGRLLWFHPRN